jgi:hypothetical protein
MSVRGNRLAKLFAPGFSGVHNGTEQQYSQQGSCCTLVEYVLDFLRVHRAPTIGDRRFMIPHVSTGRIEWDTVVIREDPVVAHELGQSGCQSGCGLDCLIAGVAACLKTQYHHVCW